MLEKIRKHDNPLDKLRAGCAAKGLRAYAREIGACHTQISRVLSGQCGVSDTLAAKLGYARVWMPLAAVCGNS